MSLIEDRTFGDQPAIDWEAIENFIGFGRVEAPVLFLGMEEGVSPGASLEQDLAARAGYKPYEDLTHGQSDLGPASRFFGREPKSQRTWRPMCHLMLRRARVTGIDNEKRCRYQADRLGRADGETLLAELLPYPNPNMGAWAYSARYPDRKSMIEARIEKLKHAFAPAPFELVVAYGKTYWPHYRRVFESAEWTAHGSFEVGHRGDGSKILLSPHFATSAFNSPAQLDEFADIALGTSRTV